jgi:hypothetical protein
MPFFRRVRFGALPDGRLPRPRPPLVGKSGCLGFPDGKKPTFRQVWAMDRAFGGARDGVRGSHERRRALFAAPVSRCVAAPISSKLLFSMLKILFPTRFCIRKKIIHKKGVF